MVSYVSNNLKQSHPFNIIVSSNSISKPIRSTDENSVSVLGAFVTCSRSFFVPSALRELYPHYGCEATHPQATHSNFGTHSTDAMFSAGSLENYSRQWWRVCNFVIAAFACDSQSVRDRVYDLEINFNLFYIDIVLIVNVIYYLFST